MDPSRGGVEDCGERTLPPVPSTSSLTARPGVTEGRRTGRRTGLPGGRAVDEVAAKAASMAEEVTAAAASATTVNEAAAMDEAEMATPDALD